MSELRCKNCRFSILKNGFDKSCSDYFRYYGLQEKPCPCDEGGNKEESHFEPALKPGMSVWIRDEISSENGVFEYCSEIFNDYMDDLKGVELILDKNYLGFGKDSWRVVGEGWNFHEAWLTTKKPSSNITISYTSFTPELSFSPLFDGDVKVSGSMNVIFDDAEEVLEAIFPTINLYKADDEFLESFKNEEFIVSCKTEDEAIKFCNWMDSKGLKWGNGASYRDFTNWSTYKEDTLYIRGKYFGDWVGGRKVINSEDIMYEVVAVPEGDTTTPYKIGDRVWVKLDVKEVSKKDDNHSVIWGDLFDKYLGKQVVIVEEIDEDGDYLIDCLDGEEWYFKNTWLTDIDPNVKVSDDSCTTDGHQEKLIKGTKEEFKLSNTGLKEEFKPFDVTFKIESEKDLKSLWAYLYTDEEDVDNPDKWDIHCCDEYFGIVDEQVDRLSLR